MRPEPRTPGAVDDSPTIPEKTRIVAKVGFRIYRGSVTSHVDGMVNFVTDDGEHMAMPSNLVNPDYSEFPGQGI